ncbi:MAG TPA: peptide transporter [Candidatus Hydrogenedentes bacterium]|nr:peptide transporter [Candidatus Hydrogenedentota bacterium]HOL77582.1 peptide transporter [Candidatus Hydrogenedentota bacterium]HPO84887.1 peptide transporter [Candidatus Hydrogenedentota bacterium]
MSNEPFVLDPSDLRAEPYEEGFSIRTMIGAVFVAFVMMPGTIFLSLIAGAGLGPAAQWVTIILFTEIARRSFTTLKRQEVYILYYMAAALAMTGGPFGAMIFNQFFVQSQQAIQLGIADMLPSWVVPSRTSEAIVARNLFHPDWYTPIMLTTFLWIMGRACALTVGYGLFRITVDVERLPFPLAPIAAEGATALAETTAKKETWRWNVFSVGAAIGLIFGAIYVGIPGFTGVLFSRPLQIIPIPFVDLTQTTEQLLPAALAGISIDVGAFITGMVLPFPMVAGAFLAAVLSALLLNPILHHWNFFPTWHRGMSLIPTKIAVDFDFWMSIGIGASLCVAFIGFYNVFQSFTRKRDKNGVLLPRGSALTAPPKGRGDMKLYWCIIVYFIASVSYISLCKALLKQDSFPWVMVLVYALFITPVISYVSARMIGLTGSPLAFPFLREGSIILSGYKGVDIWYAPLPLADYGLSAQMFRELTLTRTKFSSLVKIELFMLPLALVCSLLFWAFFWHIEAIPSATYPFTAKMWPLQATYQCLFMTATLGDNTTQGSTSTTADKKPEEIDLFSKDNSTKNQSSLTEPVRKNFLAQAIKPKLILVGITIGFVLRFFTNYLGLSHFFFYGMIGGLGAIPNAIIPMFFGALIGKRVLAKRFGEETWRKYTPVLAAGYACGVGLIGMLAVAFAMIAKTISSLPY